MAILTEASPSGGAADGQGAEAHPVWGRRWLLGACTERGHQPGPCSSTRSPFFTPKLVFHTPGVDVWSRRGAAASLRHTRGRGRPWGWRVCVPQCARSVPCLRVGVRHPRVCSGGCRTPPGPSACPGCGAVRNASCRAAEQDRGP